MLTIDMQPIPNQRFQATMDGVSYDVTVRDAGDILLMDVTANGVVIATSLPCIARQLVMPYPYLEGAGGNFVFVTTSGDNPQSANLGTADILLYATAAELAAARAAWS